MMIGIFKGYDRSETQYQTHITKGCDRSRLGVPRRVAVWSTPIAFGNLVSPDEWRRSNSRLYLIKRFADVETLYRILINLE